MKESKETYYYEEAGYYTCVSCNEAWATRDAHDFGQDFNYCPYCGRKLIWARSRAEAVTSITN